MLHAELLPVPGGGLRDLSRERLDYLTAVAGYDDAPADEPAWGERLSGLGFMTGHDHPAVARIERRGPGVRSYRRRLKLTMRRRAVPDA